MGLPVGVLSAWTFSGSPPSALLLEVAAALGGLVLLGGVSFLARLRDDDPARGAHLAAATSAGLLALPSLGAQLLHLEPGPGWWLAATLSLVAATLFYASRVRGPSGGFWRKLFVGAAFLAGGSLAVFGVAGVLAMRGPTGPVFDDSWAASLYDLDAQIVTVPLPHCGAAPARVDVLQDRGARPRTSADGSYVWFDALVDGGRRQVHRLELATRQVTCWTCDEPGNNVRPAASSGGRSVVFDSDRRASWWDPANTEVHLIATGGEGPTTRSRQLTHAPGPDDHALIGPGSRVVVWSRTEGGRSDVVLASMTRAHGGLTLGRPIVVAEGGAQWTAPLAWSPDARSLVVARGNPFAPLTARRLDLATGDDSLLDVAAAGDGAVAFNADGGWLVVATARRARVAGLLPGALGFLLGAMAGQAERNGLLFRETGVRTGEPAQEAEPLELGDLAHWGEPTGVALLPDATRLILGQRRTTRAGVEERLLELTLDCGTAADRTHVGASPIIEP